jgi:hypothetical protein
MVTMDNVSTITPWLSDALCRLSTGGGFATRALYANRAEAVFSAQRPVVVTAIDDVATRGDLLDRALVVTLPAIRPRDRVTEAALWARFEEARPQLLAGLCTAMCDALAHIPSVQLENAPRMADFAVLGEAATRSLGLRGGEFERLYAGRAADDHLAIVEGSALAGAICRLVYESPWRGTVAQLLTELQRPGLGRPGAPGWPKSAQQLGSGLRRLAPALRAVGVDATFSREEHQGRRIVALGIAERSAQCLVAPVRGELPGY